MSVNVNFKRGTQASLNTLINGSGNRFVEGTFYLTNDTDRLYFAQSATELVDLNQYIHIFSGQTLPTISTQPNLEDGDVYYWKDQNILAIYNATAGTWTQINPDTYLQSNNQNITLSDGTNAVQLDIEVRDTNRANGYGGNVSQGTFTLAGGSNVTLSRSGTTITISSTDTNDNATYTLSSTTSSGSAGGILTLNGSGTGATNTSVALKGSGSVSVRSDGSGEITIAGSGGVTAIEHASDGSGGIQTTLTTSDGPLDSNIITPIIYYGGTTNTAATSAIFAAGTASNNNTPIEAVLDVYTKAQVDALISESEATMDAMKYAGTVTSSDAGTKIITTDPNNSNLPAVGTTYKAADDFNIGNLPINSPDATITKVKAGDMLIANGTQDGNVTWDLIPSGDDQVIGGYVSGNGIIITDHTDDILGIEINGSTSSYGTIAVSSTSSNNINSLTISHGAAGVGSAVTANSVTANTTQSFNTDLDVTIVTGISKDAAGHITDVTLDTYKFKDTHNYITNVGVGVSAATTASATINISVDENDNTGDDAELTISSNNLEITSTTANNVNINLVWDTF